MTPMAPQRVHKAPESLDSIWPQTGPCPVKSAIAASPKKWKSTKKRHQMEFFEAIPNRMHVISVHFRKDFFCLQANLWFFHGGKHVKTMWLLWKRRRMAFWKTESRIQKVMLSFWTWASKNPWKILLGSKLWWIFQPGGSTILTDPKHLGFLVFENHPRWSGGAMSASGKSCKSSKLVAWWNEHRKGLLLETWALNHLALVVYSLISRIWYCWWQPELRLNSAVEGKVVEIPLFTYMGFFNTPKRWLGMGFLNHQQ